jgi:hypothetical protein
MIFATMWSRCQYQQGISVVGNPKKRKKKAVPREKWIRYKKILPPKLLLL